jgi:Conserved in the green lineage and diatoms 27
MELNKSFCPVPFNQQPLNEYEALTKSLFFTWSTKNIPTFIGKLVNVFLCLTIFGIACSLMTLQHFKLSFPMIVNSGTFALLGIELLLIRLYLGWSYILKRLSSATIFYEESGWYDGQLWIKPANILTQDRLLSIYSVEPLLIRIKQVFSITSVILLFMIILLFFK